MSLLAPAVIELTYAPRGGAAELWRCKAPEVLIEGPAGTGKSRAVWEKILALADWYPGSRHLVCRKTRESMTDSVLVTFEEKVLPPGSPIKAGPKRDQRHSYKVPGNPERGAGISEIVVGGLDKPERTFSAEYDTITVFEAIEASENDWELLQRALRNGKMVQSDGTSYHQAIADTNPGPETHWLNQRADAGKMVRLLSRHEDNPVYWDAAANDWTEEGRRYVEGVLDRLTGHRRARLRGGKWVSAEGAVYESFDAATHVVNPQDLPKMRRHVAGVDWGYTAPGCIEVFGIDGDGRMYLVAEVFRTKRLIDWWVEQAKGLRDTYGVEWFACDPAEPAYIKAFRNAGINASEGYNDIERGVQGVQARLQPQADGRPRLLLASNALVERDELLVEAKQPVSVRQEFDLYVWPKGENGKPIKDTPVDAWNHGLDALRYCVARIDNIGNRIVPLVGGRTVAGK